MGFSGRPEHPCGTLCTSAVYSVDPGHLFTFTPAVRHICLHLIFFPVCLSISLFFSNVLVVLHVHTHPLLLSFSNKLFLLLVFGPCHILLVYG